MEHPPSIPRANPPGATETPGGSTTADPTLYTNRKHGFRLNYPQGWRVQEQSAETMGMVAVFTPDVNVWDIEEQIHIMIVDLEAARMSNITLEEFTALSIKEVQQNLESVSELKTADTQLSGLPAKTVQYRAGMPQVNKRMRTYQAWCIKNQKAYMLSYNDTVGKPLAEFERKKAMADKCFASFKLIPKTIVRPPVVEMLMRTYVDTEHQFQCDCLLAWKNVANIKPPLVLGLEYNNSFMVDPAEKETVTLQQLVSVQVLPPKVTAEKYLELLKHQFYRAGIEAEFTSAKMGRVYDASQATYRDKSSDMTTVQTWLVKNNKVYTITYSYAAVVVDERPRQLLSFFLDSFDFLTPGKPSPDTRTFLYENLPWRFSLRIDPEEFEPAQPMPGSLLTIQKKNANANLTVTAQRAMKSSTQTLDEQVKGVLKQLTNTVPSFELISTSDSTLSGHPAKEILYTGSAENLLIKFQQFFASVNGILYFVCFADDATKFDGSLREAEKMLDSFTIK